MSRQHRTRYIDVTAVTAQTAGPIRRRSNSGFLRAPRPATCDGRPSNPQPGAPGAAAEKGPRYGRACDMARMLAHYPRPAMPHTCAPRYRKLFPQGCSDGHTLARRSNDHQYSISSLRVAVCRNCCRTPCNLLCGHPEQSHSTGGHSMRAALVVTAQHSMRPALVVTSL